MTRGKCSRRSFLVRSAAAAAVGAVVPQSLAGRALGAGGHGYQIGIYTRPWAQYDYRVALDGMAEAGFKYAGLMTGKGKDKSGLVLSTETSQEDAQAMREEAKKRGLTLVSVYGGNFSLKSAEEAVTGLRKLIDNVAAAGSSSLLMGGVGNPKQEELYYKTIAACCDYAAEKGMNITVKPHGGSNATGPQCRKWIESVGNKNFGMMYDPGNIFYYSEGKVDPVDDAATVDGIVRGMCVKDYQHPKRVDVTPGTGQVNFPAVLARLRKGGFSSGPLVIECLAPGDLAATVAEAKKARLMLEKLIGG